MSTLLSEEIRILHLVPWADIGGTERMVKNLCVAGVNVRHGVVFAQTGPVISEFKQSCIPTIVHPSGKSRVTAIRDELPPYRFDLVHAHIMEVEHIPGALQLARALSIPGIFTLHGRRVLPPVPWRLVCVSESVLRSQQKNQANGLVIPNGVVITSLDPRQNQSQQRSIILTVVARERRLIQHFAECLEQLCALDFDIKIWIVGQDGVNTEQVTYWGVQSEIDEFLNRTDIFIYPVLPGAHDLTVLEAMSRALPCVCTAVAGVVESITHMHDGILVEGENANGFARAVSQLLSSSSLVERISKNARRTVCERFSMTRCWSRYEKLYADLLSEASASER